MLTFGSISFPLGSMLTLGPLEHRLAEHVPTVGAGSTITPRGRAARSLIVNGLLIADTASLLASEQATLESMLDQSPTTLMGERDFAPVVATRVTFTATHRVGPRHACNFQAELLHLRP